MALELNKPLRRSTDNAMFTGVCGGLAKWLGWDPTVVRVLYVLLSLVSVGFPGILAYIVLTLLIPRDVG